MVAQHAEKRAALKAAGDWKALDEMPKNSSSVRLKNRCQLTGRPQRIHPLLWFKSCYVP